MGNFEPKDVIITFGCFELYHLLVYKKYSLTKVKEYIINL